MTNPGAGLPPDRRLQLVLALRDLAARQGHLDAPVAEIAREAGLAPGLVHYYFPRKLDLVLALVAHLAAGLEARLSGRGDTAAILEAALSRGLGEDPAAVRAFVAVGAAAARDPEVREAWSAALARLAAALQASLGGDPALAAAGVALILGSWQLGAVAPELVPPGSAAASAVRLLGGSR